MIKTQIEEILKTRPLIIDGPMGNRRYKMPKSKQNHG